MIVQAALRLECLTPLAVTLEVTLVVTLANLVLVVAEMGTVLN